MTDPAVLARGLVVEAGGTRLLGPVDLAVDAGEHALVVGPSGSGKTTLLRAVAGLAPLAAGELRLGGRLVADGPRQLVPPHGRGVGMLFQGGALWPHMTVRGTVEFVLRHRGVARADRGARVAELLELVDLVGFAGRKASTLSGGEVQRLGLARALAAEPTLLLLDEPLGPLDAPRREALLDELAALHRRLALTILHVTHDPREAARVAGRTIRMEAGRVTGDGAPDAS